MSPFKLIVLDFSHPKHWSRMPPCIISTPEIKVMCHLKLATVVWERAYVIVQV